jgi:hypothetical protein
MAYTGSGLSVRRVDSDDKRPLAKTSQIVMKIALAVLFLAAAAYVMHLGVLSKSIFQYAGGLAISGPGIAYAINAFFEIQRIKTAARQARIAPDNPLPTPDERLMPSSSDEALGSHVPQIGPIVALSSAPAQMRKLLPQNLKISLDSGEVYIVNLHKINLQALFQEPSLKPLLVAIKKDLSQRLPEAAGSLSLPQMAALLAFIESAHSLR